MLLDPNKKIILFVSTGRCGTKRLSEIFLNILPTDKYAIRHQLPISRLANIFGNLLYYLKHGDSIKQIFFRHILFHYSQNRHFICTDPLISMIIPNFILKRDNTYIIHIERDKKSFANSFYRLSRNSFYSFIAHNFILLWQINLLPLENILSNNILTKYEYIWQIKNSWFICNYSENSANYIYIKFEDIFQNTNLQSILQFILGNYIYINSNLLNIKSNESK